MRAKVPLVALFAAPLALGLACSGKTIPSGGLMLVMSTDGRVAPDRLHVEVTSVDGARAYFAHDYGVPAEATFPTTLAIASNGDPTLSIAIHASVWSGATLLDVRDHEVFEVPTARVAELDVVFSAACAAESAVVNGAATSKCPAHQTCDPASGGCAPDAVHGGALPDFGGDAGALGALDASADGAAPPADGAPPSDAAAIDAPIDAAGNDAGPAGEPPSCAGGGPGLSDCGPSHQSCCASALVPGGAFFRSYDGVTYTDKSFPATVSAFRLDVYEVTLARFRAFVHAELAGWFPAAGSGKHRHLNNGLGVNGGTEPGWDPKLTSNLPATEAEWDSVLTSCPFHSWKPTAGTTEHVPIDCLPWYVAFAFCTWDGGFLPTEAEWNYAAAGGAEQRVYPWSVPATSTTIDKTYLEYFYSFAGQWGVDVGTHSPQGDGKWGHADFAGNVSEMTLDNFEPTYTITNCVDCATFSQSGRNANRGGDWSGDEKAVLVANRAQSNDVGLRCARPPTP